MWPFVAFFLVLPLSLIAAGAEPNTAPRPPLVETESLGALFKKEDLTGTFVFLDPASGKLKVWDKTRAEKRQIPASTFKIANTVIGLENGAVKNVDEVLPYGGKPQRLKEWEQDLPLRQAIVVSSVPIYQELARRVGLENMTRSVEKLGYGNRKVGKVVDKFWLDGPLEISAVEQVDFLDKLLNGRLPVAAASVQAVKDIVSREPLGTGTLHYKTGWSTETTPQIGWLVGWVETRDGKIAPFALNIEMTGQKEADKRRPLGRACLLQLLETPKP